VSYAFVATLPYPDFTAGEAIVAVDAAESSAVVDPDTFEEGDSTVLTVTAESAAGDPLYGRAIVVTVDPSEGVTITGSGLTNPLGVATRTITATMAETYTVTVKCGGVVLDDEPTFEVTEAP
jgi:hypothetical protein